MLRYGLIGLIACLSMRSVSAGVEDYTGIWMDGGGEFGVIVGTGGTILHFNGMDWIPAVSPTSEDLFDVHGLAPNDVVASGRGVILHWNGLLWTIIQNQVGVPYTPILLTATRIWYGIPDGSFPIVGRCDRLGQGCLGLVAETGSVLELREAPSGDVILIGVLGDIYQINDGLTQTPIYDHPVGQTMEFTAATVLGSSLSGSLTAYGANFAGIHQWQGSTWLWLDGPVGTVVAMKESPTDGVAIQGVGFTDTHDGMLLNLTTAGDLTIDTPPDLIGIGVSDLDFVQAEIVASRGGDPCNVANIDTTVFTGEGENTFTEAKCRLLALNWLNFCTVFNRHIGVSDFAVVTNLCAQLN